MGLGPMKCLNFLQAPLRSTLGGGGKVGQPPPPPSLDYANLGFGIQWSFQMHLESTAHTFKWQMAISCLYRIRATSWIASYMTTLPAHP